jgi:DNA-3-methyladenine glycosylase
MLKKLNEEDRFKTPFPVSFYEIHAAKVARDLVGALLFRRVKATVTSGWIVETEAYEGQDDLGCHAHVGLTNRNAVMYGRGGVAYVYFTYGMHWLFNVVCGPKNHPAAVLIRAIFPRTDLEQIQISRPIPRGAIARNGYKGWLDGPAKLCQGLGISGKHNQLSLTENTGEFWISEGKTINDPNVQISPRIGLFSVPEPWKSIPWRFSIPPSEQFQIFQ